MGCHIEPKLLWTVSVFVSSRTAELNYYQNRGGDAGLGTRVGRRSGGEARRGGERRGAGRGPGVEAWPGAGGAEGRGVVLAQSEYSMLLFRA